MLHKVENSLPQQFSGLGKGAMPEKVARSLEDAFIWYDFFGVPQACDQEKDASIVHTTADHRDAPPPGMLQAIQGALEGCDEDGDEDNQLQSQTFDLDECDLDKMIPRAQGAPIDSPLPFPDMDDVVGKPSSFLRDQSYTGMPNKLDTAGYCGNVPMLVEQNAYLSGLSRRIP